MFRMLVVCLQVGAMVSLNMPIARAASSPLLLVGLQTAGKNSAAAEVIELANVSTETISLDTVRIEYVAAIPKSFEKPSRTITLQGSLQPGQRYRLATAEALDTSANQLFSSTLAAAGGHVIARGLTGQFDALGWGTASKPLGSAAPAPGAGQFLIRRQQNGSYQNTANNAADFVLQSDTDIKTDSEQSHDLSAMQLSEVFPDPVSPLLDAADEFIELNNTSSVALSLANLQVRVGMATSKVYSIPPQTIPAGGFLVLTSAITKLTLGNSGSRVQLLHGQTVLDEIAYPAAAPGQSWARSDSGWQWTKTPTPGEANTMTKEVTPAPSSTPKSPKVPKKSTLKKPSSKKKSTGRVDAASTSMPVQSSKVTVQKLPVHNGVIAGVGGLAVLYGAYEYRHDALTLFRKLRRH